MCGIFGMISQKPKPFNKRAFCTAGVRNDSRGGDSCGIFIDGLVEYGINEQKLFIDFFRKSPVLNSTKACCIALGHCRKASVGKVSLETAQPVVIFNDLGNVDYVLIHNGTIHNYEELAKKYIPDINIEGLTDSQVMARIFYNKRYDALNEYNGGAVFVIHDYRINQTLVWRGYSKKYESSKDQEEERPLFYCWHNGRFVFSSIFETLYAFYYEETVYKLPHNKLMIVDGGQLKLVKEYPRENAKQSKPIVIKEYDYSKSETYSFKIDYDGLNYTTPKGENLHGVYYVTTYGYVYPNKKKKESWTHEVGFFMGKMLKHPKAFKLLDDLYQKSDKNFTKEVEILLNMMDFNPHTDDLVQYYWYDTDGTCMIPQDEWQWPMADYSCVFDDTGMIVGIGKKSYSGWITDYNMYVYDEEVIKKALKKLCEEE